jgi:hypothetical protein
MCEFKIKKSFSNYTGLWQLKSYSTSPQLQLWAAVQVINIRKPIYRFASLCSRTYAKVLHIPWYIKLADDVYLDY